MCVVFHSMEFESKTIQLIFGVSSQTSNCVWMGFDYRFFIRVDSVRRWDLFLGFLLDNKRYYQLSSFQSNQFQMGNFFKTSQFQLLIH
jgi:hypothetical protein